MEKAKSPAPDPSGGIRALIELILPPDTVGEEARADLAPGAPLPPAERDVVAGAAESRRREFATARACARQGLVRLGMRPQPIGAGPRGEPLWPRGVVGSITHCAGYRGAVLGRTARIMAVGIDAEPNRPLSAAVLEAVAVAREREWVDRLGAQEPSVSWDRLLFCVKEAVYKAWYPLTGRWLDFADVTVDVDPAAERFETRLRVPAPTLPGGAPPDFGGRWTVRHGLILTTVVLPRPRAATPRSGRAAAVATGPAPALGRAA